MTRFLYELTFQRFHASLLASRQLHRRFILILVLLLQCSTSSDSIFTIENKILNGRWVFFGFTLYPSYRRVRTAWEPLAFHTFREILEVLCIEWRNSKPSFASLRMKILNISLPQVGIEPTTRRVYGHTFVPLRNH